MPTIRALLAAAIAAVCPPSTAHALGGVVVSIKPIHSLVAGVMGDTGKPHLVVRGAASPHTYSLRPSDAREIEGAGLVFWVGPGLEIFLRDAIATLAGDAKVVELSEVGGLVKLPLREGGAFEAHAHGDHDEHREAGHERQHEHARAEHEHAAFDMHLWLDPQNAVVMVDAIGAALAAADPEKADIYARNAKALRARLQALSMELAGELAPVKDKPFIVFHDAYQYFGNRFGLEAAGSIAVNPDVMPGAERLREIQAKISELGAACVFAEPQFEPKLVTVATEGTDAASGTLDPLGATLDDGPDLYFELMRGMASSLTGCLSQAG